MTIATAIISAAIGWIIRGMIAERDLERYAGPRRSVSRMATKTERMDIPAIWR